MRFSDVLEPQQRKELYRSARQNAYQREGYAPSTVHWHNIVDCRRKGDEEAFWFAVETFLQDLFDANQSATDARRVVMDLYPKHIRRDGFSGLIYKHLARKYNSGLFDVNFVETS